MQAYWQAGALQEACRLIGYVTHCEDIILEPNAPRLLPRARFDFPAQAPDRQSFSLLLQMINRAKEWQSIHKCIKVCMRFQKTILAIPVIYGDVPLPHQLQRVPITDPRTKIGLHWAWTASESLKRSLSLVRRKGSGKLSVQDKDDLRELNRFRKAQEQEIKLLLTKYRVRPPRMARQLGFDEPQVKVADKTNWLKMEKKRSRKRKDEERRARKADRAANEEAEAKSADSKTESALFHAFINPVSNAANAIV